MPSPMVHDEWFEHIPLYTYAAKKRRIIKDGLVYRRKYGNDGEYFITHVAPTELRPAGLARIYLFGTMLTINDETHRFYTTRSFSELYRLPLLRIQRWYNNGLLPPPYFVRAKGLGGQGFWCLPQVTVIVKTFDDMFSQGIKIYRRDYHMKHIEMMHRGNELAIEAMGMDTMPQIKREFGGEFGIQWDE